MRVLAAWFSLALAAMLAAQPNAPAGKSSSLFYSVRPQVTIVVREHNTGADLVQMTFLDPNYPPEVLRAQVDELGRLLASAPRGLHIFKQQLLKDSNFLTATFAVDGLIDPKKGLRLAPVVKALTGAPGKRALHGMSVMFEGQAPSTNTMRRFASSAVEVEAQADPQLGGVEYRVLLRTQDPARIDIPDGPPKQETEPAAPVKGPTGRIDMTLIALFVVAALAAGALVYSVVLRARPGQRSSR